MSQLNPFLGARPYAPADDALFFGRDAAIGTLAERVALRSLTVLTAPSGIGKTSLLRAAVLPRLEEDGVCVVYMRPDPTGSSDAADAVLGNQLAEALAQALLPRPKAELECLRMVRRALQNEPGPATLGGARKWFAGLTPRDAIRKEILAAPDGAVDRLTMVARCLRGTFQPEAVGAQLVQLGVADAATVDAKTPLARLDELLASQRLRHGVGEARSMLAGAARDDELAEAIGRLTGEKSRPDSLLARPDGDRDRAVRILLVIDQFEQLFTGPEPAKRDSALRRLGDLAESKLPLNLVLALRKEWYADLVQHLPNLRHGAESSDRTTYHLLPMNLEEAEQVMVEAPKRLGMAPIGEEQRSNLWQSLQVSDAVDAVALSVACHELVAMQAGTQAGDAPPIGGEVFQVESLLSAYLNRAVATLPADTREEALDMLGEIAGSGVTRGFVTRARLVHAPLRDPVLRERVLASLELAFLVKGDEPRRGWERVYDVMHEQLLKPLRLLIADHPRIAAFREAAMKLIDAGESGVDWTECHALLAGWNRLQLDPRSAAILLRSLLRELTRDRIAEAEARRGPLAGFVAESADPRHKLYATLVQLAETAAAQPRGVPMEERCKRSWWLTRAEIEDRLASPADPAVDRHALLSALRASPGTVREQTLALARRVAREAAPRVRSPQAAAGE